MSKKSKKVEIFKVGGIFELAQKEAEKAGERSYTFEVSEKKHTFKVKAIDSVNINKEPCVRKGYMLDGKQITAQAAKLMFYLISIAQGIKPEGRAVAKTASGLKAVEAWQVKHYYLIEDPEDETVSTVVTEFTKKELKSKHKTSALTESLSALFSKKECKKIWKILGAGKKHKQSDVIAAMDKVVKVTFDEMRKIFV